MDTESIMATISSISAAVAAVMSLVATIQNRNSIKLQKLERHAMLKPQFVITRITSDKIQRKYKFEVVNIGYDKLNNLIAEWKGNEKAEVKLESYLEEDKTVTYVINVSFDPDSSSKGKHIEGKLIILYSDILGKAYNEDIHLIFNEINNNITGRTYLEEEVQDKHFS